MYSKVPYRSPLLPSRFWECICCTCEYGTNILIWPFPECGHSFLSQMAPSRQMLAHCLPSGWWHIVQAPRGSLFSIFQGDPICWTVCPFNKQFPSSRCGLLPIDSIWVHIRPLRRRNGVVCPFNKQFPSSFDVVLHLQPARFSARLWGLRSIPRSVHRCTKPHIALSSLSPRADSYLQSQSVPPRSHGLVLVRLREVIHHWPFWPRLAVYQRMIWRQSQHLGRRRHASWWHHE